MKPRSCFRISFLCLTSIVILMGCAGAKVVEVKYTDISTMDPPYTPRDKPAKWNIEHEMPLNGADQIGYISISASSKDAVKRAAPKEAAKYGADFYCITGQPFYVIESRYEQKSVAGPFVVHGTRNVEIKAWQCDLYRIIPDPKKRESELIFGYRRCIESCVTRKYRHACGSMTLKKYLKKVTDPNCMNYDIPILYEFVNCWITDYKYMHKFALEENYEKLTLLLKAGVDPNLRIKNTDQKTIEKYYPALKTYSSPYPSVLKVIRDKISQTKYELTKPKHGDYNDLKEKIDFLTKIEAILVDGGARVN